MKIYFVLPRGPTSPTLCPCQPLLPQTCSFSALTTLLRMPSLPRGHGSHSASRCTGVASQNIFCPTNSTEFRSKPLFPHSEVFQGPTFPPSTQLITLCSVFGLWRLGEQRYMPISLFLGTAAGTSQAARWKAGSQPCSTQGPDSLWRRTGVTAFLLGNDVGGPWPCITRGR